MSTKLATLLIRSLLSAGTAFVLCGAVEEQARCAEPPALSGDIPAQNLATALAAFARETGLHVIYVSAVVRDQKSRTVVAGVGAADALERLLEGTGLRFEFLTPRSVRILAANRRSPQSSGVLDESQHYLQEVLVTGSRIPVAADISVASPMQVLTAQDVLLAGHTDASEVIAALPQVITTGGTDFGNHSNPNADAGGITTADLRGLRPQRTVVLLNGRRLGLGDPNTNNPSPAPDLDQIPLALVERVEVLTGGASATYGADAVAGVVNFILKDHVQGVQIDAQYSVAQHHQQNRYIEGLETAANLVAPTGTVFDGSRRDVSILAGSAFHDDDGQVTGYFIYHDQDGVPGSERDFSACPAYRIDRGTACLGNPNSNLFLPDPLAPTPYSVVGSQFVPWPAAGSVPPAFFNYAPFEYAQREDRRYQAGVLSHFQINPSARPYLEITSMYDQTRTGIAPTGLYFGENPRTADGGYLVNCSNPLLSTQEAGILCTPAQISADRLHPGSTSADVLIGRRNIEGRGRLASFEHRNYRVVAGVQGELSTDWSYDAYALYDHTSLYQTYYNFLNTDAINKALQVTTSPSGRPVCISGDPCVPYDIFSSGAVTAQQLDYLDIVGGASGANSEQAVEADITGQLARYGFFSPFAHDGVAVNLGAERRTDALQYSPDAVERSGNMSGFDTAVIDLDQRISVNEGFVEIRAPLVQDHRLVNDLTVDAGYRYSAYSIGKSTNTFKFGLQFAPITQLRLRASYDRVIRAPNLIELYTPLKYGYAGNLPIDPCAPYGATPATASLRQCLYTGITAAQYGDGIAPGFGGTSTVPQCGGLGCRLATGGNPALAPETADTWSLGLTLAPVTAPSVSASIDYFHIHLDGEIGTVPETVTMQQCLATGDPTVCSQIVRTKAGALYGPTLATGGYILGNAVNTGSALVSGIDLQGSYLQALPGRWGTLEASLNGSWMQHNAYTPYRSAPSFECAGLFGNTCLNGSVNPRWRHNLRVTWETLWNAQLSAQWRFIQRTEFDNNSPQALLRNQEEPSFDSLLTHIPNYSYLDLSAIWVVSRVLQFRLAVNNVFDKDPPFVPQDASIAAGGLNTFPTYDILGRNISVALRATF